MDWLPFIGGVVAGVFVVALVLFAIVRANEMKAAAAKEEQKTQSPAAAVKPTEDPGPVMTSTAIAPADGAALDAAASRIQAATREAKTSEILTSEIEAQALPQFRAGEEGATAGPLGELDA